jgi:hypothetical protein
LFVHDLDELFELKVRQVRSILRFYFQDRRAPLLTTSFVNSDGALRPGHSETREFEHRIESTVILKAPKFFARRVNSTFARKTSAPRLPAFVDRRAERPVPDR